MPDIRTISDHAVTNWQLRSLGAHIDALLAQQSKQPVDTSWIRREFRAVLESSIDLLTDVAVESGLDDAETPAILAMRDIVAIHLVAAAEVEAAGGRPETVMRLLTRAAVGVHDELTLIAATR